MNKAHDSLLAEAGPVVRRIFDGLYEQIEKKRILQDQDPAAAVDKLQLKGLGELKNVIKRHFRGVYTEAKAEAQKELLKGGQYKSPIADEAFLEFLEAETYGFIGDWAYQISKQARVAIIAAIKDGKALSAVLDAIEADAVAQADVSLERYARTKITEVMNRGRVAFFQESGVVDSYQYSAILDDRTSYICEGLHGKIFKAGSEPIPPLHFNCRSLLIPITRFEEKKVDTEAYGQPIEEFIEQNKGDGFSKYSKDKGDGHGA
jgi:SPP1 gp7 family putative phage head morphogenesis protein